MSPPLLARWPSLLSTRSKRTSSEKATIEERFNQLTGAVEEKKIKEEDGIPKKKMDRVRSPSPPTDIPDDKKTNWKAYGKVRPGII